MAVGDDRNVDETWIAGKRAYKKPGKADSACRSPSPLVMPAAAGMTPVLQSL